MIPELILAAHLKWSDGYIPRTIPQRIRHVSTGGSETPLPLELSLIPLLDPGTGDLMLTSELDDLVSSSVRYLRALAVLPVDPDAEVLVDRLVSERVRGLKGKRRLRS